MKRRDKTNGRDCNWEIINLAIIETERAGYKMLPFVYHLRGVATRCSNGNAVDRLPVDLVITTITSLSVGYEALTTWHRLHNMNTSLSCL